MSTEPLIHVVDDDESLRKALLRLLGAAGFENAAYVSAGALLACGGMKIPDPVAPWGRTPCPFFLWSRKTAGSMLATTGEVA